MTGVKINSQGLQKPCIHRSNKELEGQETKYNLKPTIKYKKFVNNIIFHRIQCICMQLYIKCAAKEGGDIAGIAQKFDGENF